jgi:hypothetical protein
MKAASVSTKPVIPTPWRQQALLKKGRKKNLSQPLSGSEFKSSIPRLYRLLLLGRK